MNTLLIMFIILVFLLYYSFNTNEHFYNGKECYNAETYAWVVFDNSKHTGIGAKHGGNCYDDAATYNNPALFNNSAAADAAATAAGPMNPAAAAAAVAADAASTAMRPRNPAAAAATAMRPRNPAVKDKSNSQIAKSKSNSESKTNAKANIFLLDQFDNTCCTDTILCNDDFIDINQECNSRNTSNGNQNDTSSSQGSKTNPKTNPNSKTNYNDSTPPVPRGSTKTASSGEYIGQLCSIIPPDKLRGSGCGFSNNAKEYVNPPVPTN